MELHEIQILESVIVLIVYTILFFVIKTVINNALKHTPLQRSRRKIIIKVLHLFVTLIAVIILSGIWGFEQNEIAAFASSVLTVLGIAFFAQWSLLSNITSSIILFFHHPLKLGDTVRVLDKEYPFEGEITELTYFYVHLKTASGEVITIPNSIFLQKSVAVLAQPEAK